MKPYFSYINEAFAVSLNPSSANWLDARIARNVDTHVAVDEGVVTLDAEARFAEEVLEGEFHTMNVRIVLVDGLVTRYSNNGSAAFAVML